MPGTAFSIFVFDFDGTLVQSAGAKRKAFFDIFQPIHAPAVEAVLTTDPDASRFVVIPMILAEIEKRGLPSHASNAALLVEAYSTKAEAEVAASPEFPGASALLNRLARLGSVYVVSNTPHEQLLRLLRRRQWEPHIAGAFGYPNRKTDAIAGLLQDHKIRPSQLLVVGDGVSDADAARTNGCSFHMVRNESDLKLLDSRFSDV